MIFHVLSKRLRSPMLLVVDEQESHTKKFKLLLWSFHQAASELLKSHIFTQCFQSGIVLLVPGPRTDFGFLVRPCFQQFVYTSFQ